MSKNTDTPGPFEGIQAVVIGLGKSGRAAARLLADRGADVTANDAAPAEKLSASVPKLEQSGVDVVAGTHDGDFWTRADLVVVSPGVPDFPQLQKAQARGLEVIGETELASRVVTAPIVAIGGTNGKSTCTTLFGHIAEAAERHAFVGGNLGDPSCSAAGQDLDVVVLEVSSFQMERVPTFKPKVGILLNITEDHLDRYEGFSDYAEAKGNCFANQDESDVAIIPTDDELCLRQVQRGGAKVLTFGAGGDFYLDGHDVVERATDTRYPLKESDLHGRHNYLNAAAAIAAARSLGISSDDVQEGLIRFRALPHRMALSGRHREVTFYDDSKATNVGAAVTALRGLTEEKGVLIAGGRDKLGAYSELIVALKEKARAVVLIGEATERLAEAIGDSVPVHKAQTLQGAVIVAYKMAFPGDAVLLSPACSSLDMFKNYAERGDRFTEAVAELVRTEPRRN